MRKAMISIDNTNSTDHVSFKTAVFTKNGKEFVELIIVTNSETIYRTSDYKKVLHPPRNISILLNEENMLKFISKIIKSISPYLLENDESSELEETRISIDGMFILMRLPFNTENRHKIIIDIFRDNEQIISFKLSKTRIILLINMIKNTFDNFEKKTETLVVRNGSYKFNIVKAPMTLGIAEVWLRNAELEILKYFIHSLIYDFKFLNRFEDYKKIYRQLLIFKNIDNNRFKINLKKIDKEDYFAHFYINSNITAAIFLCLKNDNLFSYTDSEYYSIAFKKSEFLQKIGKYFVGFEAGNEDFNFEKDKGHIELTFLDDEEKDSIKVNLGSKWMFMFSEMFYLLNNSENIPFYSHQWKYGNNHIVRLSYAKGENLLLMVNELSSKKVFNVVLENSNLVEFLNNVIKTVQKIKNFRFQVINKEDEKKKLSLAKIDDKFGTIITTFNGIKFGKPHLSESDKHQIKYSALYRLFYGRWLSVHAERINISSEGIITTVDEEYILDTNKKNKSELIALALISSLSFGAFDDK